MRTRRLASIAAALGLALVLAAPPAGLASATTPESWFPPGAREDALDWVQLTSNEWLRGEITLLRDEVLEFDSEELGDLELDWSDVLALHSPRVLSYAFLDGEFVTGTAEMRGGVLRVEDSQTVHQYAADQVHAILEGELTEANYWSASVNASVVARSGNTDQSDLTSRVDVRRETTASRLTLQYRGNYGRTDGVETVDNHRGSATYNLYLSRRLFVTPVTTEVFADEYQNIDLRTSLGGGLGYYLLRADTDWWVDLGGGYQNTRYVSVLPGEADTVDNGTISLGTALETDLRDNVELDAEYRTKLILGTDETVLHHVFVALSVDLWGDIDFDASLTWDHNTEPKPNADGVVPDKNDVITAYGLSIDF